MYFSRTWGKLNIRKTHVWSLLNVLPFLYVEILLLPFIAYSHEKDEIKDNEKQK